MGKKVEVLCGGRGKKVEGLEGNLRIVKLGHKKHPPYFSGKEGSGSGGIRESKNGANVHSEKGPNGEDDKSSHPSLKASSRSVSHAFSDSKGKN